ncbi:MAG: hypothetical protein ETSY1_43095 [Candidatus Entotheonella factor]|uniref:Uncharacterized protein n=1 Tax=Entotheonella factor TaxID=1429438 RepID=W4L4G3_ENTF1|nr:hypothetical protein [Candidatus Entotheonella palauensis]ETW92565.1 MAG: hypothetical protein ETSY1_43095 [Candidatus Entotheonella factor]
MSKRNPIQAEQTDLPSLSTDAPAASPGESLPSLPVRTSIRAGVSFDWHSLLGSLEEDAGSR